MWDGIIPFHHGSSRHGKIPHKFPLFQSKNAPDAGFVEIGKEVEGYSHFLPSTERPGGGVGGEYSNCGSSQWLTRVELMD